MRVNQRISDTRLWQHACESFMGGAFHAIGARISALSGIAEMARMAEELDADLTALLLEEIAHLTDVVEACRLLPRSADWAAGPTQMGPLVPPAIRLLELNLDARNLEIRYRGPEDGLAVAIDATTLVHSFCVLLLCLSWHAVRSGQGLVDVQLREGTGALSIHARVERGTEAPTDGGVSTLEPQPDVVEEGLEAIRRVIESAGGRLDLDGSVPLRGFRIDFPVLT